VAVHHQVHDYACCHLQADCLESGISSGRLCSITSMGNIYLYVAYMQSAYDSTINDDLSITISLLVPTIIVCYDSPIALCCHVGLISHN